MDKTEKQAYIEEIKYQKNLLNKLKRYLRNFMSISSISLAILLFAKDMRPLYIFGIVALIISVTVSLILGLAIRNGSRNIQNIITFIEK